MKAKHRTYCAVCQIFIRRGEEIGILPTGRWGHAGCAQFARNKARITSPDGDTFRSRYSYRGRA